MATFHNGMQIFNTDFFKSISHGFTSETFDFSAKSLNRLSAKDINANSFLTKSAGLRKKSYTLQYIDTKDSSRLNKLICAELKRNPQLVKYCSGSNLKHFSARLSSSLLESGYKVDVSRVIANNKFVAHLVSLVGSGLIEVSPSSNRFVAHASVPRHHRILLLSSKQLKEADCVKVGFCAYLYHGRPAISAFSFKAINALNDYYRFKGSDSVAKTLLKTYNIKLLKAQDLDDETTEIISGFGERDKTNTFLDNKRS